MNIVPLISFVFITTFTPGPNNISSAAFGISIGYKRTLPYLLGIMSGFFFDMLVCAFLSKNLIALIPDFEKYMKYLASIYIVYLAWGILNADYEVSKSNQHYGAFQKGFLLQLFNPKVAVYGLTLYTTFLVSISNQINLLFLSAAIFAATAFCAISLWALFGTVIGRFLKNNVIKKALNISLALLLILTAIELSEVYTLII